MANTIDGNGLRAAVERSAARMAALSDVLNRLDAAMGDGDLGITVGKGAAALRAHLAANPAPPAGTGDGLGEDLGRYVSELGMSFNRAASSTMGALVATALMRAGKEARGLAVLDGATLARMLQAADAGVQERGKAKPGDKSVVDVLHPAAEAFAAAIERGETLDAAGLALLQAARQGRDAAIPLRSKIGRSGWVGERTENQPDAGTVLLVNVLEAVLGAAHSEPGSTTS